MVPADAGEPEISKKLADVNGWFRRRGGEPKCVTDRILELEWSPPTRG